MTNEVRVYFDACCFIDMAQLSLNLGLESGRDDHAFFCKQFIDASRAKEAVVVTSTLTLAECIAVKDFSKMENDPSRKIVSDEIRRLFEMMILSGTSGVMPYQQTPATTRKAVELSFDHRLTLGAMDRLHIATALISKCTHLVTSDKYKNEENIRIINGLGLVVCTADTITHLLPDKYKQLSLSNATKEKADESKKKITK